MRCAEGEGERIFERLVHHRGRPAILRKNAARNQKEAQVWIGRMGNLTTFLGLSVLVAFCAAASIRLRVAIFENQSLTVYGNYCGPDNGQNYTLEPLDMVDVLCRAHDMCIESSFPGGTKIPIRSHTEPRFGCDIMRCDKEFVRDSEQVLKRDGTRDIPGVPRQRCDFFCRTFLWIGLCYHKSKIAQTRAAIATSPSKWRNCDV